MRPLKHTDDSPTNAAMTSSNKKRILSELIATRNTIKNKFKKAFTTRVKRERKMGEVMKPITKSINEFAGGKKKKEEKDEMMKITEKPSFSFKPKRLFASTPKSIIRSKGKRDQMSNKSRNMNRSLQPTFDFHSALDDNSYMTGYDTLINDVSGEADDEMNKYLYEISYDDDRVDRYDKVPDANMTVFGTRTLKETGHMEPIRMKFSKLPLDVQNQWKEERKYTFGLMKGTQQKGALNREVYTSDEGDDEGDLGDMGGVGTARRRGRPKGSTTKRGKGYGINMNSRAVDFDFIPYSASDRIVYEYFDDPNELCERLRLLVSSRMAGNTNHMQEINSIIEELRELGCIA